MSTSSPNILRFLFILLFVGMAASLAGCASTGYSYRIGISSGYPYHYGLHYRYSYPYWYWNPDWRYRGFRPYSPYYPYRGFGPYSYGFHYRFRPRDRY